MKFSNLLKLIHEFKYRFNSIGLDSEAGRSMYFKLLTKIPLALSKDLKGVQTSIEKFNDYAVTIEHHMRNLDKPFELLKISPRRFALLSVDKIFLFESVHNKDDKFMKLVYLEDYADIAGHSQRLESTNNYFGDDNYFDEPFYYPPFSSTLVFLSQIAQSIKNQKPQPIALIEASRLFSSHSHTDAECIKVDNGQLISHRACVKDLSSAAEFSFLTSFLQEISIVHQRAELQQTIVSRGERAKKLKI